MASVLTLQCGATFDQGDTGSGRPLANQQGPPFQSRFLINMTLRSSKSPDCGEITWGRDQASGQCEAAHGQNSAWPFSTLFALQGSSLFKVNPDKNPSYLLGEELFEHQTSDRRQDKTQNLPKAM